MITLIRCRKTWPFILISVWKIVLSTTITSMATHANYLAFGDSMQSRKLAAPFAALANAHLRPDNVSPMRSGTDISTSLKLLREKFRVLLWWTAFYSLGAIVGLVGVIAIVHESMENERLKVITAVFGCVVGLGAAAAVSCVMSGRSELGTGGVGSRVGWSLIAAIGVAIFEMLFLFAFYTDWVLAALAGDMVGLQIPGDNFWSALLYFFAKRLPMLSM
ncbi:hypothetical protein B0T25DRAFT_547173 [Lasiosphaeria hispida]|uniref:Uncharacterized protein n=1 Tax=Lasiosphaeria hispida TaxID=260671 RepID=A0AAJ0MC34_9PEZI|nr:hypothetical protein B0T25DRAFT_547173 [Lasiosphaeria hispida]